MLASTLNFANNNPIYGSVLREILGSNVPQTLLTKTNDERLDKGLQQFACTAFMFGGGAAAHVLWDATERLLKLPTDTTHFGRNLGKTSAIYSFASFGLLAVPYLRNAFTLKRTNKSGFAEMAGVKVQQNAALTQNDVDVKANKLMKQFATRLGLGLGLGAASFAVSHLLLRKVANPVSFLKPLTDWYIIEKGDYSKAGDSFALLTALAGYTALLHGSRDKVEKQEVLMRAIAFPLGLFFIPKLALLGFNKLIANKPMAWAGGAKNAGSLLQMGLSTGIYASITLAAMHTREARAKSAGLTQQQQAAIAQPLLSSAPLATPQGISALPEAWLTPMPVTPSSPARSSFITTSNASAFQPYMTGMPAFVTSPASLPATKAVS
jgi:hypothetical protein